MKRLISILLLGCSGPAFITEESTIEQGNNQTAPSGGADSTAAGGRGGQAGRGTAGESSADNPQAGNGGATAMAGRPAMGEGGASGDISAMGPRECLSDFQNLTCAKVCTNAQACDENGNCQDCQAVLSCYVSHDSLDNCTVFTSMGISLAEQARRNCCHV